MDEWQFLTDSAYSKENSLFRKTTGIPQRFGATPPQ